MWQFGDLGARARREWRRAVRVCNVRGWGIGERVTEWVTGEYREGDSP